MMGVLPEVITGPFLFPTLTWRILRNCWPIVSLEVARFVFRIVRSLWNLTGTSAAVLPMCLSNCKAIRQFKVPISWLRDFTRSYGKTSFRILRRGPVSGIPTQWASKSVLWLFICSQREQTVEKTVELQVNGNVMTAMWLHCNAKLSRIQCTKTTMRGLHVFLRIVLV